MNSISSERLAGLMSALQMLYEPCSLDDLPMRLLAVARRVVQADGNAYNEVNPKLSRAVGVIDNPDWKMEQLIEPLEAYMHEHPVINYCHTTHDGSARKISDFMSLAELHRTGLYNELYRPLGVEYQIAITIPTAGQEIVAVVVNRTGKDFDEEDRSVLNLLRPHVGQAYQNALAMKKLQDETARLNGVLGALEQGVVVLDARFRIRFASQSAQRAMKHFFGPRSAARLPSTVQAWLERHLGHRLQPGALPVIREPLRVFAGDRWLLIRLLGNVFDGELTLTLQEQASAASAAENLRPLGLTPREAEVLYWVVQGKTNPEIANICGSSARTVQKHLEHVFEKLGVETRTAAARRANELL